MSEQPRRVWHLSQVINPDGPGERLSCQGVFSTAEKAKEALIEWFWGDEAKAIVWEHSAHEDGAERWYGTHPNGREYLLNYDALDEF